jgi:hypothetical protein
MSTDEHYRAPFKLNCCLNWISVRLPPHKVPQATHKCTPWTDGQETDCPIVAVKVFGYTISYFASLDLYLTPVYSLLLCQRKKGSIKA